MRFRVRYSPAAVSRMAVCQEMKRRRKSSRIRWRFGVGSRPRDQWRRTSIRAPPLARSLARSFSRCPSSGGWNSLRAETSRVTLISTIGSERPNHRSAAFRWHFRFVAVGGSRHSPVPTAKHSRKAKGREKQSRPSTASLLDSTAEHNHPNTCKRRRGERPGSEPNTLSAN